MHDESRAHTLQTLGKYLALVQRHHHGNQMEGDSGACDARRIAAAKIAFEQPATISCRNADTVVANLDHEASQLSARDNFDRTSCRRILDGV